jgi:NCS1 family nucleobase:cation symporter-1
MEVSSVPKNYSERLYNEDLAPVTERTWTGYSLFAMCMADVHSIGGYTCAAGLFFLGLAGWQVFLALLVGIIAVYFFMNSPGSRGRGTAFLTRCWRGSASGCSGPTSQP